MGCTVPGAAYRPVCEVHAEAGIMRNCTKGSDPMHNSDWDATFLGRCYYYPGRDCPGWGPGGVCGRVGNVIPDDAETDDDDSISELDT